MNSSFYRKLNMDNPILRDPITYSNRLNSKKVPTYCLFIYQGSVVAASLLPFVKLLRKENTTMYLSEEKYLGVFCLGNTLSLLI